MRTGNLPFKFNLVDLLARARRQVGGRVGDVTLSLPFISFSVSPKDREKQIARELVVRLRDRRVLSAWECCDNCIDSALRSLQEIRRALVDKQVELTDLQDGPLYLLIDAMAVGIRQFLTFEEMSRLNDDADARSGSPDHARAPRARQAYFDALEVLRGHLSRCLCQVAKIAGMPAPDGGLAANYQGPWPLDAYEDPREPS